MAQPLDLDAYFSRINYTGPRAPTYDALTGILRAHVASIPFESFDVLLGRPIRLDTESLQAKIVTNRRGGYCFEHGSLMHAALEAVGFAPVRHASRVLLFEPRHESVRQHMFLTVKIDGATYVIDPGFGPFACPVPIPLDGAPVPTSAPTHRLVREGNDWVLYVTQDGQQVQGWTSPMDEEYPVDFEMMNYYISSHPASFFTHNILASAATNEGRVNIIETRTSSVMEAPKPATWRTARPCGHWWRSTSASISPNSRRCAWMLCLTGSEQYFFKVRRRD